MIKRPPQFTETQWADILEWYWDGRETGYMEGYLAGYREAWNKAWSATTGLLPAEYQPRTAHIRRYTDTET